MAVMVKILITTIQVNFCAASQNLPELSLLKFLPLTYHHSHFLAATLDFTSFFTIAFLRAALFLQLGCFGLDLFFLRGLDYSLCTLCKNCYEMQTCIVEPLLSRSLFS